MLGEGVFHRPVLDAEELAASRMVEGHSVSGISAPELPGKALARPHEVEDGLRNLGLGAPIIKTQTGLSRSELSDKIVKAAGKDGQVLVLTDFDREGKDTYRIIEKELEIAGVKNLKRERRLIRKYMDTWTTIEQLVSLFKRSDSPEASR
jgi:5S rRNA maturation endonuclease (ribonuclease M5)